MKWVRSTDRLPEKAGRYFAINSNGKKRTCLYYSGTRKFTDDVAKWLDESEVSFIGKIKAFFK